jgi:small subunit ribosomal protein S9
MTEVTKIKGSASDALGTGRRKKAVARARIRAGSGVILINERPVDDYFTSVRDRADVLAPLVAAERLSSVDVSIQCHGGGPTGQAGAAKLAVARALKLYDTALEPALRQNSLLTRDSRMKERKHYGLRGARRGTQFSKR